MRPLREVVWGAFWVPDYTGSARVLCSLFRSASKHCARYSVAGSYAKRGRSTTPDFEHRADWLAGTHKLKRLRFRIGNNQYDRAISFNEDHIEGNQRVLHPKCDTLWPMQVEEHAGVGP